MNAELPQPIHLHDYRPTPYRLAHVDLAFSLDPHETRVVATLQVAPNGKHHMPGAALVLDGETIKLHGLAIDGVELPATAFAVDQNTLTIAAPPAGPFTLTVTTTCNPAANTELSGLYISNGMFCTQCEAEGFRRITYFYDRPDVMAPYRVRIEAEATAFPVLLSNGNPRESGVVPGSGRHFAVWDDPHPKPSYLFALVAGDLAGVTDRFRTAAGAEVRLGIYVEKGKEDRCGWAMESLKASMRWDEETFGREYDLEVFNIVAVSNFNMGAMENKGLNIFNDKYILALPGTATDTDYANVEAIIAHEYFHNWTGNRITCRDWFQLCLKEGLTVYRDQEFTSDMRSRAVKRISDVRTLRARQFPEDGGPLAHPVRPSRYIEINNFYTPTVYEKGAEICRMMATLIGRQGFRKAMDLYFARHDGEAATVEDFVRCMADASGHDFTRFFRWYEQAGTPHVVAQGRYDATGRTYELTLEQTTPATPGDADKQPLVIPLGLGLVGPDGVDLPLDLEGSGHLNTPMIVLTEARKTFRFRNVAARPALSLNREFSAPILLTTNSSPSDQLFLMGHDGDTFNRWEAGQTRGRELILAGYNGTSVHADVEAYGAALGQVLGDDALDDAFKALMLMLPTESDIAAAIGRDVDTDRVHQARDDVRRAIGRSLWASLLQHWTRTRDSGAYSPDSASTGRRALRYALLPPMLLADFRSASALAAAELETAQHMTAEIGVLSALVQVETELREAALAAFHQRHGKDHLLVDKWFMLQAQTADASRIEALFSHPDFTFRTPNRAYALIGTFTSANPTGFNAADGEGYRVVADAILTVDALNPQVAARLATGFRSWRMFDAVRRDRAQAQMQRILATRQLSRDCYEIVSKISAG
jgi:aminopeptidase N